MKNMLWKVFFLTNIDRASTNNTTETKFVLKSKKCSPQVKKFKSSSLNSSIIFRINSKKKTKNFIHQIKI